MSEVNLQKVHDDLVALAHEAGQTILTAKPTSSTSSTKKNSADLVTETDQAVENLVISRLKAKYPDYDFIGEETYTPGQQIGDGPTFICDPIDGTTNFYHGHPYLCISLALAVRRKAVVGVVFNPYTNTLYTGIRGGGSFVTGVDGVRRRLPLREGERFGDLSTCLVAVEWGSEREGNDYRVKVGTFGRLCASKKDGGAMVHGIRSLGSAELNLCGVAEGGIDLYWESGCWAWDVAAGWVILEEAGGRMVGCHEGDWEPRIEQRRYMGVRGGENQKAVIEEFWSCVQGRVEVGFDAVS